jgi:hypothetical protein
MISKTNPQDLKEPFVADLALAIGQQGEANKWHIACGK